MTGPRVLIVDDDHALLDALPEALRLRMDDVAVDTVDSASAALDRIAGTDYDVIVTDIKMPGMDGLALLAEIRARRPETPTLMITGHGEHDLAVQALRGGAYDFIQKPIDREYFVASLARAIGMRRLARQVQEQRRALERHAEELEETVEARTRELRAANRTKDELLAVLSHELRAPLTTILAWAEILKQTPESSRVRTAAEVLVRNVHLQIMLVDDLLDLARMTQGGIGLDRKEHDLRDIVVSALDRVADQAWQKAIRLERDLPAEAVIVHADAGRLHQVFANLLWNAVKFTPRNGKVSVTLGRDDRHAVAVVRDTGGGIDPAFLPFIFQMFRQQEEGTRRRHDGAGLGLALTKYLVELHAGTIEVASEGSGRGAEFTIRLPLASGTGASAAPPTTPALPRLTGMTILLVEDLEDTRMAERMMLEALGARVIAAGDGLEALDALAREAPHVVLCDLRLPVMDGFEFIRRVREDAAYATLPVIAVSALGRPGDYRWTREAGFDGHLTKPFDYAALASALEPFLRRPRRVA